MEDQLLHGQATKLVNAYQKQSQTRARRPKQIGKEEKRTYVNRAATKVASVNPHLEVLMPYPLQMMNLKIFKIFYSELGCQANQILRENPRKGDLIINLIFDFDIQ
jgi:hypothetical protein